MSPADEQLKPRHRFIVNRQNPRRPLKAGAIFRNTSKGEIRARLVDISEHGCKIELDNADVSLGQKSPSSSRFLSDGLGMSAGPEGKPSALFSSA